MLHNWLVAMRFTGLSIAVICLILICMGSIAIIYNSNSLKEVGYGILAAIIGFVGFCFFVSLLVN